MTEEMVTSPLPPIIDWAKLRQMSRSNMKSKMLQGWTMLTDYCEGKECKYSPLMSFKGGEKICVVCDGSGSGLDGVYDRTAEKVKDEDKEYNKETMKEEDDKETMKEEDDAVVKDAVPSQLTIIASLSQSTSLPNEEKIEEEKDNDNLQSLQSKTALSFTTAKAATVSLASAAKSYQSTIQNDESEFEQCRSIVSREIGKRMLTGWTLLDTANSPIVFKTCTIRLCLRYVQSHCHHSPLVYH